MKTLIKKLAAAILIVVVPAFGIASGEIRGKVTEPNGEAAVGAIVRVLSGSHQIAVEATDAEGKYVIKPLDPGKYDVVVMFTQYQTTKIENVEVLNEEAAYVDVEMKTIGLDSAIVVVGYQKPVIDRTVVTMHSIGGEDLNRLAVTKGDIKGAITAISSDIYQDPNDGELYLRGSRKGSSTYFVDGEKMMGGMEVPGMAIQSVMAITGGIPAQYGDLTGGAIVITTADYFSGMRDKTMWIKAREDKKKAEAEEQRKKDEAEKRLKEIEEEKKKLKEENQKKEGGK